MPLPTRSTPTAKSMDVRSRIRNHEAGLRRRFEGKVFSIPALSADIEHQLGAPEGALTAFKDWCGDGQDIHPEADTDAYRTWYGNDESMTPNGAWSAWLRQRVSDLLNAEPRPVASSWIESAAWLGLGRGLGLIAVRTSDRVLVHFGSASAYAALFRARSAGRVWNRLVRRGELAATVELRAKAA